MYHQCGHSKLACGDACVFKQWILQDQKCNYFVIFVMQLVEYAVLFVHYALWQKCCFGPWVVYTWAEMVCRVGVGVALDLVLFGVRVRIGCSCVHPMSKLWFWISDTYEATLAGMVVVWWNVSWEWHASCIYVQRAESLMPFFTRLQALGPS